MGIETASMLTSGRWQLYRYALGIDTYQPWSAHSDYAMIIYDHTEHESCIPAPLELVPKPSVC